MQLKSNLILFIRSNYKKILIFVTISIFLVYAMGIEKKLSHTPVIIEQNTIYAQIADTDNERSLGLSFTKDLDQNAGMLFVFDEIGTKNFWMRDMNYDLDIIWIDEDKNIIGFFENVVASSYNPQYPEYSKIYKSPATTKYVLELKAGSIEHFKIQAGDKLDFKY